MSTEFAKINEKNAIDLYNQLNCVFLDANGNPHQDGIPYETTPQIFADFMNIAAASQLNGTTLGSDLNAHLLIDHFRHASKLEGARLWGDAVETEPRFAIYAAFNQVFNGFYLPEDNPDFARANAVRSQNPGGFFDMLDSYLTNFKKSIGLRLVFAIRDIEDETQLRVLQRTVMTESSRQIYVEAISTKLITTPAEIQHVPTTEDFLADIIDVYAKQILPADMQEFARNKRQKLDKEYFEFTQKNWLRISKKYRAAAQYKANLANNTKV